MIFPPLSGKLSVNRLSRLFGMHSLIIRQQLSAPQVASSVEWIGETLGFGARDFDSKVRYFIDFPSDPGAAQTGLRICVDSFVRFGKDVQILDVADVRSPKIANNIRPFPEKSPRLASSELNDRL